MTHATLGVMLIGSTDQEREGGKDMLYTAIVGLEEYVVQYDERILSAVLMKLWKQLKA